MDAAQRIFERYKKYLLVMLFAAAIVSTGKIVYKLPDHSKCNDFAVHYLTSRIYLDGKNPYGIELEEHYRAQGFVYDSVIYTPTNPPTLTAFFAMFCFASPSISFTIWILFQTACLVAILEMLRRHFFKDELLSWFVMIAIVMISEPLTQHFQFAQVQLFLILLVYGGFYCLRKSQFTLGCTLVAIAGVLKIYPLVLLPWFLWQGDCSVLKKLARGVIILGASALAMLSFGLERWLDFGTYAMPLITDMAATDPLNNSVPATMLQLYTAVFGELPSAVMRFASVLVGLSIILAAYVICVFRKRTASEGAVSEVEFGLMLLAMIAGSATAWLHYYLFLLIPLIWLAKSFSSMRAFERFVFVFGVFAMVVECNFDLRELPVLRVLVYSTPVVAVVACYVLISVRLIKTWSFAPVQQCVERLAPAVSKSTKTIC